LFFCSKRNGTNVLGTVRANKNMPNDFEKKLKGGNYIFKVAMGSWLKKGRISAMSTFFLHCTKILKWSRKKISI
jgi:hypothetical protein